MEELKRACYSWYEFRSDASILLASSVPESVIDMLNERCREVIKIKDADHNTKFDYIIDHEGMNTCDSISTRLQYLLNLLKSDGTLLCAFSNRYGLKYFCGTPDPFTGVVFDGINGYMDKVPDNGRCFSKKEIEDDLKGMNYKFYYPLPDLSMPQLIYTDNYKESSPVKERLLDLDYNDRSMFGLEHRILPDAIEEGALPFLSNSFIVEIGSLSDIRFAVITEDRGPKRGMATTIRDEGRVIKRPLYKEGESYLRKLAEFSSDLKKNNVPVVDLVYGEDQFGGYASSKFMELENLGNKMRREAKNEITSLQKYFDLIHSYVIVASGTSRKDETTGETILSKAYIDLAPFNAFADGDGIVFYDQEFMEEDTPAEYVMFRILKYFFQYAHEIKDETIITSLYSRYGITKELCDKYEVREAEFIRSVRSREKYEDLYKMATPDREMIEHRMKRITEDGSKPYRIGYVPGVFDLPHRGHINLLRKCKERCQYLIVGVLTDDLVEYYKNKRPVMSLEERSAVLEAITYVDEIIPVDMSNTDKLDAWEQLHYDCHFSGDDHVGHWNDVLEELRKRGSNMEFFSYTEGISSTSLKEKLQLEEKV